MTIDGSWTAVVAELGGQHIDEEFLSAITLKISGTDAEMHVGGNIETGTLKFIPYVVPMAFDFTAVSGKVIKAIYKVSGGFLIVCYHAAGGDRPKTFVSTPENQHYLVRYKRPE